MQDAGFSLIPCNRQNHSIDIGRKGEDKLCPADPRGLTHLPK
jgi:hypothetical protein